MSDSGIDALAGALISRSGGKTLFGAAPIAISSMAAEHHWHNPIMSDNGRRGEEGPGTGVIVKAKPKTKKPSMYKVLMLNDDYTPMEFVVHILERFFNKNRTEATRIMLHVHRRGVGVCGVYTYEVAETKVTQVMDFARQHQHPLQCTLEKD
jgi:ATP-dependent Clp protease adaptor protein ClpS